MKTLITLAVATVGLSGAVAASPSNGGAAAIEARLMDPNGGIVVVAHRGCHAAAPDFGLTDTAPENSLAALERCVAIGADMMETDVRRAGDGTLVMFHDATVDRTTDGKGAVAEATWAELARLRLRNDLGGPDAALTDQHPVTLDAMLAAARGRIMLNLDVKAAIYPQVADAVRRAGMERTIVIKTEVGPQTPAMAGIAPFAGLHYMPILLNPHGKIDLLQTVQRQLAGTRPSGIELPYMTAAQLPPLAAAAKARGVRLWANTLWEGFVGGYGGDEAAVRAPDMVWGRLYRDGVSILQTDAPGALLRYRDGLRHALPVAGTVKHE